MLAPLRVTMLTPAPTKCPWRTSYGATLTWISSTAAVEMGVTPVRSPGWPPSPNELLKYDPSTVMLLSRLSCPMKLPPKGPPEYCGLRRA